MEKAKAADEPQEAADTGGASGSGDPLPRRGFPHHQALEEVEDQICSHVKDEPGLTQVHSPREFQIGQSSM